MGEDTNFEELLRKRGAEFEDDAKTSRQNSTQQNNVTTTTGELDKNLLAMCNGQLRALADTINKLSTGIIVVGIICMGMLAWMHQAQSQFLDDMRQHTAFIESAPKSYAQEVLAAIKGVEDSAERASKHVWELKHALKLKFSQEHSAGAAQDGEE